MWLPDKLKNIFTGMVVYLKPSTRNTEWEQIPGERSIQPKRDNKRKSLLSRRPNLLWKILTGHWLWKDELTKIQVLVPFLKMNWICIFSWVRKYFMQFQSSFSVKRCRHSVAPPSWGLWYYLRLLAPHSLKTKRRTDTSSTTWTLARVSTSGETSSCGWQSWSRTWTLPANCTNTLW